MCMTRRRHSKIHLSIVTATVMSGAFTAMPSAVSANSADQSASLSGNYLAGYVAQKRRDLPAAIKYLGDALDQDNTRPDLIRRAFLFSVMDGRVDAAMGLAERYVEFEPAGPITNLALAIRDVKKGNWKAVKTRLAALDDSGLNAFTKPALLAWTAFAESGLKAGMETLKPLRDIGGTRALHDLHAGLMNELAGDLETAEKYYLGVAEDESGASLRGARILGTLYERQGKTEEAKAAFNLYL
jgi:tetratricopeptide (TPR) repeat protein